MKELEEKILSMLVNGESDIKEYNATMREYVKALVQEEFEIDYYEDSVYSNYLWDTIVDVLGNDKFVNSVITEDYHENRDDYKKSIQEESNRIGFTLRLEV